MKRLVEKSANTFKTVGRFLLLALVLGSCTLDALDDDINGTITEEDLEAASQIIGESLSSNNSGVILSLNDALTNISSDGFTPPGSGAQKSTAATTQNDDSGRGNESNYTYSYNPSTGIHTVTFTRSVNRPLFTKEVSDTLQYLFTDDSGTFVEFPRAQSEQIKSIKYSGKRQGSIETIRKNSSFSRTDSFLIDGVSNASAVLQIDGVHNGTGHLEVDRLNGNAINRNYQLEINFLNIEIDKELARQGLERGVTGTLSWEMIIEKSSNGSQESKTIRGTIEMNGDGTALLRFQNFLKIFQVNLSDGDVKDQDEEFEGRVESVNTDRNSFLLLNGREIFVNEQTEFDDDYSSLSQIQNAINSGTSVWAEGEGYRENDRFIATEVEFENEEESDGDSDEDSDSNSEFEDIVTAVDLEQGTFLLAGSVTILVDEHTLYADDSEYLSLEEVKAALNQGTTVTAEGEAETLEDGTADLRAFEVSFESEKDDGADGHSDSD